MTLSIELFIMIIVNIITGSIYVGGMVMSIKFIEKQLSQLEKKVEYHNNVVARMFLQEENTKTCFKKLDELRDDIKDIREEVKDVRREFKDDIRDI